MLIPLLFPVVLTLLGVVLLFKQRLAAATTIIALYGVGYFFWGIAHTAGVPSDLVAPDDMTRIWTGVGLIVFGIALFYGGSFRIVRSKMPSR